MQPKTITFPFPRRLAIWAEPCLKVGRYLVSEEGDSLPSIDTMEQLPYADFLNSGAYEPNIGWIDPFYWDTQSSLDNPGQPTKNQTQQIDSSIAGELSIGKFSPRKMSIYCPRSLERGHIPKECLVW